MSPYYITQGDLALTDVTITQPVYSNSMRYSYHEPTYSYSSGGYDYPTRKKQETVKQRHIREGAAFKCFYGKGQYTPIDKNKTFKAERKEKAERVNKFKGLNENLMIK